MRRRPTIAGFEYPASSAGFLLSFLILLASPILSFQAEPAAIDYPIVFTQVELAGDDAEPRSHLALRNPDGTVETLTTDFYAARDPDVSFDGERILFSAKAERGGHWQVYEMNADGSEARRITRESFDCRQPLYQSYFYVITSDDPWHQISFIGSAGGLPSNLYSTRLDGSEPRRLTFNPYGDTDPFLMPDGRILLSSRQSNRLEPGEADRQALFGVNLDGADYAVFSADEGARWKRMPAVTTDGLAVFVENDERQPDGSGWLAAVTLRRNLHSHRRLSERAEGLYHSPSPLPGGEILVSRRPAGGGSHGLYRFSPGTGGAVLIHDDPGYHDIQGRMLAPRPEPDGRSSVVSDEDPTGILYCLNAYQSDFPNRNWMPPGSASRLRVVEGLPRPGQGEGPDPAPARRVVGEIAIERDGSFNIRVPANIPLQLQLLDENGLALRTCSWIWVKNGEPRGCIGCHEDNELTPENRMVDAMRKASISLTLPPERRRRVTYEESVLPIVERKCANGACHGGTVPPRLREASDARVHAAKTARTSPLAWRLFGRNMSRPWDETVVTGLTMEAMPPEGAEPLTEDERRTILEWIDLGAE